MTFCHSRACVCVCMAFATSSERRCVCVAPRCRSGSSLYIYGIEGFSFNTPLCRRKRARGAGTAPRVDRRSCAQRISVEDMPTWEAPRSAAEAAKAALKALRGGTQSQPRGIDALFKPPTTGPWSRDKQGAVLCALLIGVTVVLVSARRRRRTGDGLTLTINLQLSELPEEWKKIFSEAGVTQARTNAQNVHGMCITRHTCMRLHSLLLPHT